MAILKGTAGIRRIVPRALLLAALLCGLLGAAIAAPPPPSESLGDLYRAVEMASVFPDQKTFADAVPRQSIPAVLGEFRSEKSQPGFSLRAFVAAHFRLPALSVPKLSRPENQSVDAYLRQMWTVLRRAPDRDQPGSSLLPLRHPYIVPGGRFDEIYYWDSYFTMLGLMQHGQDALAASMLANMADLIDRYGHVPNGNRTYYLSRSQPPFFAAMVTLVAEREGAGIYRRYLPEMEAEYRYWMEGAAGLQSGMAHRRVVRLRDGALLNRYWDDRAAPRDESWRHDVETARAAHRPLPDVYRELRAAAESGWDFSSRWLTDGRTLGTIRTTAFAPVDLNALMQNLENTLAKASAVAGDPAKANFYAGRARARAAAIRRLMWNQREGIFMDYLWQERRQSTARTAATVYPLYFGIASPPQAHAVAATIRQDFLRPGGMATTLVETGQQWDRPNGWAPLEYLAVAGLDRYGEKALARQIAARWIHTNVAGFKVTGVLQEKYNIERPGSVEASGGEYALQIGFGWTNGVLAKLRAMYPGLD